MNVSNNHRLTALVVLICSHTVVIDAMDPEWWPRILSEDTTGILKRCFKKTAAGVVPNTGNKCSRFTKICFFGTQECPALGPHPTVRCECDGLFAAGATQSWNCAEEVCPDTEPPSEAPSQSETLPPTDCNGIDLVLNPDAGTEICDGIDNNCDGTIDEGFGLNGEGLDGGGQPFDKLPPAQGLNAMIATTGSFPTTQNRRELQLDRILQGGPEPFLGQISWFAADFAPAGWAKCDGQEMLVDSNQALFALLGVTYGGDGEITFALPDLRGRTPIHQGAGLGLTQRLLGSTGGSETAEVTSFPLHSHCDLDAKTSETGAVVAQEFDLMPPYQVLNCIIALQGIFPSPNRRDLRQSSSQGHRSLLEPYLGGVSWVGFSFAPAGWAKCDGEILQISQFTALFSIIGNTYGGDVNDGTFALPDARGRMIMHPEAPERPIGQSGGQETFGLAALNAPSHDHGKFSSDGEGVSFESLPPFLIMPYVIAVVGTFPTVNRRELKDVEAASPKAKGGDSRMLLDFEPFVSGVGMLAGSFAPSGFVFCNGDEILVSENNILFSLLGEVYGGDGQTTVGLPDLKGRVPMHAGDGLGLSKRVLGEQIGEATHQLSLNEFPEHFHDGDTCSCADACSAIQCSCGC